MGKGDDGVLIVDSADKTPPTPARPPHSIISYDPGERRPPARRQLPPQVWILLTICALLPVVAGVAALWRFLEARPWLADTLGYGAVALLALGALLALWGVVDWLAARRQRLAAEAAQAALARGRLGTPFNVRELPNFEQMVRLEAAAAAFELARAPYTMHPMLSTMSNAKAPELPAPPAAGADPLLIDAWLPLLNDPDGEPHLMLAGKTKAGKSTLAELLIAARVTRGDDLYIIDPHYQPINKYGERTWCGLYGAGGESWDATRQALAGVHTEYERRKLEANQGRMPQGGFPPLTVVVDEALEIAEEIKKDWEHFQAVMGSGARKYSIYIIVLTQSIYVKDIGGSTAKRENFVIIGLGEKARQLVEESVRDPAERAALLERLRGEPWAAAMERNGEVVLLDRSEVKRRRPERLDVALWQPQASPRASAPGVADLLRDLREAGWTRDDARRLGLPFDNGQWTEAGK